MVFKPIVFANGFSLTPQGNEDSFLGIGDVTFQGVPLRSSALPWIVYFESDQGFRFDTFRLEGVAGDGDSVTLSLSSSGTWNPRAQEADAMGDARIRSRRLKPPEATVRWRFQPIVEQVYENAWHGLGMTFEIDCPGSPIHWALEEATWEIGGSADKCTLIQQDVSTIDLEQTVSAASSFSTIERFKTTEADAWGGSFPMDMLPRAAGASICDFQVKGDTVLCLFAERPSLTRARIDKFTDEDVIHYADRPFFPLTEHSRTPERKLLVYRHHKPLERFEWRNLWIDCFTDVRRRIHETYGFELEIPLPTVSAHLWDDELRAFGQDWTNPLERALPVYVSLGYCEVFTHGVWDSVTSDPAKPEGNICCPYSFTFAEEFGGARVMRGLMDEAHSSGLRFYQWFGMQFSSFAPIWKEHPEWQLREANGDPWDANYRILTCGRMRSPFADLLREQVLQVKADTGLDNVFWDSYQNLGVTCVDWQAPDKAPQAEEIWAMQVELQRAGFKQRCEVVTIFGVSQVAMYGFESDAFRRRLWADTVRNDDAFALLDTSPCYFTDGSAFTADKINPHQYFWLAGHRCVPIIGARPWLDASGQGSQLPGGDLAEEYARVNRLYNTALPRMHRLRVVDGGAYALWLDAQNHQSAVWAFRDADVPFHGFATDLGSGEGVACGGRLIAKPGCVYMLEPAASVPMPA